MLIGIQNWRKFGFYHEALISVGLVSTFQHKVVVLIRIGFNPYLLLIEKYNREFVELYDVRKYETGGLITDRKGR